MTPVLPLISRTHGGPDPQGVPLHDFSTNSNACGPCPQALAAVQAADATVYPDACYAAVRASLAAFHGVEASRIVLAGSASEFIFRVTAWAKQQGALGVCLPAHAYGDYAHAAQAWGLEVVTDSGAAALVWACEPSSPLGQAHGVWPAHLRTVVLDGAYAPLRLSGTPSLNDAQRDALWQLFSPNKALGLTGVRAAYAIAPAVPMEVVAQLEALAPSWPVGAHGVAMLQAWVSAEVQAWLAASLPTLRAWKAAQLALCESLGWTCLPSDANFFCALPVLPQGVTLVQALVALRARGIKLRDTMSFGLPGHVRLGVARPEAQQALRAAWPEATRAAA